MGLKTRLSEYEIKESALDKLVEPIARMGWKLGEYGTIDATAARDILRLQL
jgi:NADP-dependent alcohol dehydrogenase